MGKVKKMNFSVDKIVDGVVVLENINTLEKVEVLITDLPDGIVEGNILTLFDGKYIFNTSIEEERRKRIKNKLDRLKRLKHKDD